MLASWTLLPLILLLLAIPVYALALMLLFLSPPLLTVFSFRKTEADGERLAGREILIRLGIAWFAVPLVLLGFIAPVRALLLAVFGFFSNALAKFHEAHAPLYAVLQSLWGPLAVWKVDLFLGVYGVLALLFFFIMHAIRRNMLANQIRLMPTAKARSVAMGMAELSGKAIPLPGAPRDRPIIRSWFEKSGDGYTHRTDIQPFYLEDGTGMILIDPRGASVDSTFDMFSVNLHQVKLRQVVGEQEMHGAQLMPGDTVFVVGSVQLNRDEATRANDPAIVRPRKSSLFRLNYYDVFFVTNISEKSVLETFQKSIIRSWIKIAVLIAITAWMPINSWTNLAQLTTLDPGAPPEIIRGLSAQGILERPMRVNGGGEASLLQALEAIRSDSGNVNAYMGTLERERLGHFAIPVLQAKLDDINSAGFGNAIHWLARLNALPPGFWGIENGDEGDGETLVHRVALRRVGTILRISYRAHFNRSQPINEYVAARSLVVRLKSLETGQARSVSFPAEVGWNIAIDKLAFDDVVAGNYEVTISVRREFSEGTFGRYDTGSRPLPTMKAQF